MNLETLKRKVESQADEIMVLRLRLEEMEDLIDQLKAKLGIVKIRIEGTIQ